MGLALELLGGGIEVYCVNHSVTMGSLPQRLTATIMISGIELISQIDKTLSEYSLFASVQFSLIFKIGSGKLKGFLHRLIVLQDPVAIS